MPNPTTTAIPNFESRYFAKIGQNKTLGEDVLYPIPYTKTQILKKYITSVIRLKVTGIKVKNLIVKSYSDGVENEYMNELTSSEIEDFYLKSNYDNIEDNTDEPITEGYAKYGSIIIFKMEIDKKYQDYTPFDLQILKSFIELVKEREINYFSFFTEVNNVSCSDFPESLLNSMHDYALIQNVISADISFTDKDSGPVITVKADFTKRNSDIKDYLYSEANISKKLLFSFDFRILNNILTN